MERGLLWLPLLALFIGLAWAGWNEYQKLEAYKVWAEAFDHAKYDIYAVLGVKEQHLTWGVPTRKGPIDLHSIALRDVQQISVMMGEASIDLNDPPSEDKKATLSLGLQNDAICNIPFTQLDLAVQWAQFLIRECPWVNS
ncbi:MAG: hypothetical protein AAGA75_17725 [Cyanobacteria bacterium P01_E01_bin.6]